MSSTSHGSIWTALCALALSACGGGGGGGSNAPVPDTTAPDTTLIATPTPRTNLTTLPFSATSNEANVTFEARVDNGAFTIVPALFSLSGLDEGLHSVQVRTRDAAGNIDASPATFDFVIDRTPPDTTLVSGPAAAPTTSTSATFTFTSENNASFQASVDGAAFAQAASPLTLSALGNGEHTVQIRAMDQAANVDATPASVTWTIDIAAPAAQVVFPTRFSYTEAATLRVRGAALDRVAITAVSVNGVAASTTDAFAHWTATVPIAAGDNALHVSTTDVLGNTTTSAARVDVANRGIAIASLTNVVWDGARNRAISFDWQRNAVVAIDGTSGRSTILSDASRGTGPTLVNGPPFYVLVDATHDRVIAMNSNTLLAIDPVTGNRSVIPTAPVTPDTQFWSNPFTCNADCSILYAQSVSAPSNAGIFSIDLQTGVRTLVSGGSTHVGQGFTIGAINGMAFDPDALTPRLIVLDFTRDALFEVILNTGNRTVISSSADSVGLGPGIVSGYGFAFDPVNDRAYVSDRFSGLENRVVAVDLGNGNRSVFATTPMDASLRLATLPTLDAAGSRLLVTGDASAVIQVSLTTGAVRRFADSNVGSGTSLGGSGALLLDTTTQTLTTTVWNGISRIALSNGDRSVAVTTLLAGGYTPGHLSFDTRAGVPPGRLIGVGPGTIASPAGSLRSYDLAAGTDTYIAGATFGCGLQTTFPLDAQNGRLLGFEFNATTRLVPFDATTGAVGSTITDSAIGSVPFGFIHVIGFDNPIGAARRILIADNSQLLAVDPASGARTLISSVAAGTGPALISSESIAVDSAARRALIVGGRANALQSIDLGSGNRSMASGVDPNDQSIRGAGPPIAGDTSRVAADFANQVAFLTVYDNAVMVVDLTTGDRVITSR